MQLRQTAEFGIGEYYGQTGLRYVTFDQPTLPGSLIVLVAAQTLQYDGVGDLYGPSGWSNPVNTDHEKLGMAAWYRQNAASVSSLGVYSTAHGGLILRAFEYTQMAQSSVLDRVTFADNRSPSFSTGTTAATTQADELVFAAVANRYRSTNQTGFTGGLTRLTDSTSPNGDAYDSDDQRLRLTTHHAFVTSTGQFRLAGQLTTSRDWCAVLMTFKGGSLGPAQLTARNAPPALTIGGRGALTAFGPLRAVNAPPAISISGGGRIGPFELQMRLGGWDGLLIGKGTPYRLSRVEGLGGWDVQTSDGEFPRGDGAQRGFDLQAARQVLLELNFDDDPAAMEAMHAALLAALVPQRETDLDLLFRRVGRPLQLLRYRPVQVPRDDGLDHQFLREQKVVLQAADPRIYSARERIVEVPVTPAGATAVTVVSGVNDGNARAYPLVRIVNRGSVALTGLQLVNASANVGFEIATTIPAGAELVGDMPARITAAPRSVVTLDGQPKYGAWQAPREPFYLAPHPAAANGANALYLRTTPDGADVLCTVTYRDTWAG